MLGTGSSALDAFAPGWVCDPKTGSRPTKPFPPVDGDDAIGAKLRDRVASH
jgi:hypothetical protein